MSGLNYAAGPQTIIDKRAVMGPNVPRVGTKLKSVERDGPSKERKKSRDTLTNIHRQLMHV